MTDFQKVIGKIVGDVFENCNLHIKIILYFCASKKTYTTMNEKITALSKEKTRLLISELDYLFPYKRDNIRRICNKRAGIVSRA